MEGLRLALAYSMAIAIRLPEEHHTDGKPFTAGCWHRSGVVHFSTMSHTITVRLPRDLAEWLQQTSQRTGIPQGRIIREQLERARAQAERRYMELAGRVEGPPDLSSRKGFSRS
jgi:predicted DNA-binding protein